MDEDKDLFEESLIDDEADAANVAFGEGEERHDEFAEKGDPFDSIDPEERDY